jgi:hypothetical protein
MKAASSLASLAAVMIIIAAAARAAEAQEIPIRPGPAALSVPHPIPPPLSTLPVPPRDLYQHLPPPPPVVVPTVIYPFVYGPSMYVGSTYMVGTPIVQAPAVSATPRIAQGGLRFESSPGSAQIYVDGRYVGVIDDFGLSGRALDLDEGAHRVELRAAGYATLDFDVAITAYQTTRYRGELQRLSQEAPAPAVTPVSPARPKMTYVIPNCYAGDRPPSRALPRGCDIRQLRVSSR